MKLYEYKIRANQHDKTVRLSTKDRRDIKDRHTWKIKNDRKGNPIIGPYTNRRVRRMDLKKFRKDQFEWDFLESRPKRFKVINRGF